MSGNVFKLVFKSFADSSGIAKWGESVKSSIGNMGQMSRAAQMLGATMGNVGGAIGSLVGALAQGSVWGVATQGVAMLVNHFDLFGRKAEEARKKNDELAESARQAYADVNARAAKAIESINKELQTRKAMADIVDRQCKAELQLRRAEALRSGDLAKARSIEAAMSETDRAGAVDRADAEAVAAEKKVAEARRALDAAQKQARDAQKREAAAEDALAARSRPVETTMQSSAGAFTFTKKRDTTRERQALETARKDVAAADAEVDAARAAYDIEVARWRAAKENAKAVAKEQEAAAEKEHAERLAAARKEIEDRKAAEKAANDEWVRQRKAAAKKAAEEEWIQHQKNQMKLQEERRNLEREMLQAEQKANTDRANDLREKLRQAQNDADIAFGQFRDPMQIDMAGERRARRQDDIDRTRLALNAVRLQERNPNWRTARNLSRQDEATRRWLLAKENEQNQKKELADVVGKLGNIERLLQSATTL